MTRAEEDVEKVELSCAAGMNVKMVQHCGKHSGSSSKSGTLNCHMTKQFRKNCSEELKIKDLNKDLCMHIHHSFIDNSQMVETAHIYISGINKLWNIHIMEYRSGIIRYGVMINTPT